MTVAERSGANGSVFRHHAPQERYALRWAALIVLLAGGFVPPVNFFIVNVALASIHESLHATPAEVQLVVSGYAAGYAVFLITGGRLGDLYGRRRCFLLGVSAFTLTSLWCGVAATPAQLVVARVVQGASAAVLLPQVLGSMRALFPDERELAKAMSGYAIMMGLAAVVGQFAGGALIQWNPFDLGWRAVFLLSAPVGVATLIAGAMLVPQTGGGVANVRLDFGGAFLASATLASIVVPLSEGRDQGWPFWVFAVLAMAPVLAAVFFRYEAWLAARGGMPLVDTALFRIPSFRRGVLVATLFFFTTSFYLLFGLYQQEGRGVEPLHTGLAIVPYGIGLFLGPLASAPFVRLRPHLLTLGMAVQVTFYALIGVLVALGITGWVLSATVLLAGFGQGIAFPRLFASVLGEVPADQAGVAAGITNTALQVGAAVSVAAIGSLFFSALAGDTSERSYAHAFAIAQWTLTTGLFFAMLLSIPRRRQAGAARAG